MSDAHDDFTNDPVPPTPDDMIKAAEYPGNHIITRREITAAIIVAQALDRLTAAVLKTNMAMISAEPRWPDDEEIPF